MSSQKRFRQGQILKLIDSETITSQEDLRRRLAQTGVRVTQATLSRDLHQLRVVKGAEGYRSHAAVPAEGAPLASLAHSVGEFLLDIRPVQNLLVLKTPPGGAQPLAAAVDAKNWKEVAGTIAGDDTILVITPSSRARLVVHRRLKAMLR
jgi:transcriptional regulator of arginine metabolism